MLSLQKNNSFLYLESTISHSKINKHPAYKMNWDEQGGSMSKSRNFELTNFLNDPKVILLQSRSIF